MQKIKVLAVSLALSVWCYTNASLAVEQAEPAVTSAVTVEALLQAENKSIMQRLNTPTQQVPAQTSANSQLAPVNKEVALLSIYGPSSDLRINVKYGDLVYAGLAVGETAGPLQVVSIEGLCADLLLKPQPASSPVRHCWSQLLGNRQQPKPSKSAQVQGVPFPKGMALPSLPAYSGMLGLPLGASPGASLSPISP